VRTPTVTKHSKEGRRPKLGNQPSRAKWHVSTDLHALQHNNARLQEAASQDSRWQILASRLLSIGGTTVCACLEEDMALILASGRTWIPKQKSIILAEGDSSHCHENTLLLKEANPHLEACTGWALSNDGIWRQHSWCINPRNDTVVETTLRRLAYHGFVLPEFIYKTRLANAQTG
jgi:hypothetical protein